VVRWEDEELSEKYGFSISDLSTSSYIAEFITDPS
jgi:hypothetical protein